MGNVRPSFILLMPSPDDGTGARARIRPIPGQFQRRNGAWGTGLKLGRFGEMEVANFHGRDDHLKGLLASGAHGGAEEFNVFEHFDERLIEAEIADGSGNPTN